MQKFIIKYGLATHLAFAAVAPLFFPPLVVIWIAALAAVWLIMEPSRIGAESLHAARARVAHHLFLDPLFWVLLALIAVTVFRMLNVGVALAYDAEVGKWALADPFFPLLPGSVEGTGLPVVASVVDAAVVIEGCRHGLGRRARAAFALSSSFFSAAGAFVFAMMLRDGSKTLASLAACPLTHCSFAGVAYGIGLALAIVALTAVFEFQWLRMMPVTIVCVAGNALGLFMLAPPTIILLHVGVALVILVYGLLYLKFIIGRLTECKALVFFALGLTVGALAVMSFLPNALTNERIDAFLSMALVPKGFVELRSALSDVSLRIWKTCPWLGTGLGSFSLDLQFHATPADWQVVTPFQKAIPNGYWMLLVERGVIGAFFLAVPLILLLVTYFHRLVRGIRNGLPSPMAWTGLLVLLACVAEMLVDCSCLRSEVLVAAMAVLALSANSFLREKRSNG